MIFINIRLYKSKKYFEGITGKVLGTFHQFIQIKQQCGKHLNCYDSNKTIIKLNKCLFPIIFSNENKYPN